VDEFNVLKKFTRIDWRMTKAHILLEIALFFNLKNLLSHRFCSIAITMSLFHRLVFTLLNMLVIFITSNAIQWTLQ